jgi:hypothetical protein
MTRSIRSMKSLFSALVAALCLIVVASDEATAAPKEKLPWEEVEHHINVYFAEIPGLHVNCLITQSQVEPLWNTLAKIKWHVPVENRDELMALIPTEKEYMVQQLHTAKGYKFMRNVAVKYPEIYDRLDMLSRMGGGGKPAVSGLIAAPDAAQTVKYMFSKYGKRSWAAMLPERGKFDKPTGRIYTAEELKSRLQQLYTAAR